MAGNGSGIGSGWQRCLWKLLRRGAVNNAQADEDEGVEGEGGGGRGRGGAGGGCGYDAGPPRAGGPASYPHPSNIQIQKKC